MIIKENRHPRITKALAQTGAAFPEFLSTHFERILQRIEFLWGEKEAISYFESLFLGDAPEDHKNQSDGIEHPPRSRQGFPLEAVKEIVLLKQVHQLLFPSLTTINPFDPFSGNEITPIESASKAELLPINLPSLEFSKETNLTQTDLAKHERNVQDKWPLIRTQHELIDIAKRQHAGKPIYPIQGKQIGEIFMHYGYINEQNVEQTFSSVREMQKKLVYRNWPVGKILVEVGLIKQEEVTRMLLIQAGIPMVDILSIDIPQEITKMIPIPKAREKLAVPIGNYNDTLYLAVPDPFTFTDQAFFKMMTGMKVKLVFAPLADIVNRINMHGINKKTPLGAKEEFRNLSKNDLNLIPDQTTDEDIVSSEVSENDSTIVTLVNQMIFHAIQEDASDIHIELFNDGGDASIRFRRDGHMDDFSGYPRSYHKAVVSRIKIISGLDISEKRRPQDGKFSFRIAGGRRIDLRVATIPAMLGVEFVTIRILASGEPAPLSNLGMEKRDEDLFREAFQLPYGLILVCGPTGSGKTTTLHSVLKELNTKKRKIWTAEDPVEIVQSRLCQVQVNSKIGMTFANVLRSFLRADPDVIMIGEMRDPETAQVAVEASMTGHLVFSTLHTNTASETVARLLALGIDPYNLSDALQAILAQRLARKLCTACATRKEASAKELDDLANDYYQSSNDGPPTPEARNAIIQGWRERFGVDGKLYLMHAVGCKMCNEGYKGRIGLYELLHVSPSLRNLIRKKSPASEYLRMAVSSGMKTLKQDGIEKVLRGITDRIQVHGACI